MNKFHSADGDALMLAVSSSRFAKECLVNSKKLPEASEFLLRQAVRSTYYAIFQFLSLVYVNELIGDGEIEASEWVRIYRGIDHKDVKQKLIALSKDYPEMKLMSDVFTTMQEERHLADYNPLPYAKTYNQVEKLIENADHALLSISSFSNKLKLKIAITLLVKTQK